MCRFENNIGGAKTLQKFYRSRRIFEVEMQRAKTPDMDLWKRYIKLNNAEAGYYAARHALVHFENLGTDELLMKKNAERGDFAIKTCMQTSGEILSRLIFEQRFKMQLEPNSKESQRTQEDIRRVEENWLSRPSPVSLSPQ